MKRKAFCHFIIFLCIICAPTVVRGSFKTDDPAEFKKSNPDINKYEFVKSYISSLQYLKLNSQRVERKIAFSRDDLQNNKRVKALLDSLILDNANLRIARNYVKKYQDTSSNGLIRKVSEMFVSVCDDQIKFNNLERILLEKLIEEKTIQEIDDFKMGEYIAAHEKLGLQRKESLKKLLEASLLVNKVLISDQMDSRGEFNHLALTAHQRKTLLFKLDEFYGEGFEGELREGQTFLEASVVSIRNRLEDPSWKVLE